jgi:hypothetical protein
VACEERNRKPVRTFLEIKNVDDESSHGVGVVDAIARATTHVGRAGRACVPVRVCRARGRMFGCSGTVPLPGADLLELPRSGDMCSSVALAGGACAPLRARGPGLRTAHVRCDER